MKTKTVLITILFACSTLAMQAASPTPTPSPTSPFANCSWVGDKLQNALADVITKVVKAAGDATDFLIKELPDVIKQLLWWKAIQSLYWCIWPIIFTIIMYRISLHWKNKISKDDWGECLDEPIPTLKVVAFCIFCVATLIGIFSIFQCFNLEWLQIWVAPKVYLIEYANKLIHNQ